MSKLDGKVAVVTGGSAGIGLAVAARFAKEGAHVFITGRRQSELEKARAPRPGYELACSRLAEGLLMLVLAQAATRVSDSAKALRAPVDPRLQRAMRAVREDLARPWTLQSIAREAGMSRTLFACRFRDALGGTVADYLRTQRIQRAQELLGHNVASVETVCAEVGFSSVSSFSRSFLKIVGVRPGEFARRHAPPTSGAPLSSTVRDTSPRAFAERGSGRQRVRRLAG